MDLVNPFESVSKAQSFLPQTSTRLRALVKTGGHLGHGQDLKVVRRSGGGGRKAGLEHYSKSVGRGLGMISRMAPPSSVPATGRTASRVVRGNMKRAASGGPTPGAGVAGQLRGSLNFGDAGSKGRRVV